MKVVWSEGAADDVAAIHDYIARFNPGAARRVAESLVIAADSLSTFPLRGRRGRVAGSRELAVVHPYVIVYDVLDDRVEILRVWHGSRNRETD